MKADFLKRMFEWGDEVIDAAQSPAAKLASTLLPILAPLVPAFITAIKLHGMYLELIGTNLPSWIALAGAIVTAVVLEFLGWVGTIAVVRFLYRWVKTKEDEYIVPFFMSFIAYVLYIINMVAVNTKFANQDTVFLLLALFSVPAGFMFAVSLVGNEEKKDELTVRREQREERLEKYRIRHGGQATSYQSSTSQVKPQKGDWRRDSKNFGNEDLRAIAYTLSAEDLMQKYGLERRTAFQWKQNAKDALEGK